jgi:hypothetical protein
MGCKFSSPLADMDCIGTQVIGSVVVLSCLQKFEQLRGLHPQPHIYLACIVATIEPSRVTCISTFLDDASVHSLQFYNACQYHHSYVTLQLLRWNCMYYNAGCLYKLHHALHQEQGSPEHLRFLIKFN